MKPEDANKFLKPGVKVEYAPSIVAGFETRWFKGVVEHEPRRIGGGDEGTMVVPLYKMEDAYAIFTHRKVNGDCVKAAAVEHVRLDLSADELPKVVLATAAETKSVTQKQAGPPFDGVKVSRPDISGFATGPVAGDVLKHGPCAGEHTCGEYAALEKWRDQAIETLVAVRNESKRMMRDEGEVSIGHWTDIVNRINALLP